MRSIRLVLIAVGAVLALSAFGVSSASALPLFIAKGGKYPVHASVHGGLGRLNTASGHEIHCTLVEGLALFGLLLGLLLILFHKCSTTLLFSKAECNSPKEAKGLIHVHIHFWLGYLTNGAGEKMVGIIAQPENSENIAALLECEANAFEHVKVTVLGEVVGEIASTELNKLQNKFNVEFKQSSNGIQSALTFLLPSPLALMNGVHLLSDVTGSIEEKTQSSEEATGESTLDGGEVAEIKG